MKTQHADSLRLSLARAHEFLSKGYARWEAVAKAGEEFNLNPKDQEWLQNEVPKARLTASQIASIEVARMEKDNDINTKKLIECFYDIILAASAYWVGTEESDFHLQVMMNGTIHFGRQNHLVWTAANGFRPISGSETFLRRCAELGALPGQAAH